MEDQQNPEQKSESAARQKSESAARQKTRSSRKSKKVSRRSHGGDGISTQKRRSRVKLAKQLIWAAIYLGFMFMTMKNIMEEHVRVSLVWNAVGFVFLWIFRVLTHQKISRAVIVKAPWFYMHLGVLMVHALVAIFFDAPLPTATENTPQYEQPNYVPPEEE
jgi:cation transport ATPase